MTGFVGPLPSDEEGGETYQYGPRDFGITVVDRQPWIGEASGVYGVNMRFTDLSLYAGPNADKFIVHRTIVCHQSGYLWARRNRLDNKDTEEELCFPDILPRTMMTVIRYLYEGNYQILGYEMEHNVRDLYLINDEALPVRCPTIRDKVVADFEAASILDIPGLKNAIVAAIGDDLSKIPNNTQLLRYQNPIEYLCRFFALEKAQKPPYYEELATAIIEYCDPKDIHEVMENAENIEDLGGFLDVLAHYFFNDHNSGDS